MIIDIHNHLAWDVDDGIATKEDTITVLKQAQVEKIESIIATPHFVPGSQDKQTIKNINKRIDELKDLALQYNINIIRGCELFMNHNYLDMIDAGLVNNIENTDYLLIEFDVRHTLGDEKNVEDRLYELEVRNYKIIIAHIERYFPKGVDIARVRSLYNMGYVIQVNKSSILGHHGKIMQKNALKLIDEGLVHIIASDTHRTKGRDIIFKEVYDIINQTYGPTYARKLFYINPQHILKNENIENLPKVKRGLFGKIKRR